MKKRYVAFSLTVLFGICAVFLILAALLPSLDLDGMAPKISKVRQPGGGWTLKWEAPANLI